MTDQPWETRGMTQYAAYQQGRLNEPLPTDLSQARIAELLAALTSGPIGDAILGLVRGEKQIVARLNGPSPNYGYVVSIEDKPSADFLAPPDPQRGWKPGDLITYRGVNGAVVGPMGHDMIIQDPMGQDWRIRHDNGEIERYFLGARP